jgi:hypothetical protein
LVCLAKKKPKFLSALRQQVDDMERRRELIAEVVQELNQEDQFVDSAHAVQAAIARRRGEAVVPLPPRKSTRHDRDDSGTARRALPSGESTVAEIRDVMKRDLGMRYRKVVAVSVHANGDKNLILRQQYAQELIRLLASGRTILNIDETWLGMSDFRRRKWQAPGTTNSVAKLAMTPRISMIAALDTRGQVYLCLIQANNNSQVMEIYFRSLVKKLDKERPRWRHDTVVLLDNAPYHTSKATLKVLEGLDIPVCYSGPHSYDAAPCELLFAAFKSRDINPRHVQTGKK